MTINTRVAALLSSVCSLVVALPSTRAVADTFGSSANTFEIEFVEIGDPGNAADTTGESNPAGAVDYVYNIGKYEISRGMIGTANSEGGLGITLMNMTDLGGNGPNQPATRVSWFEAATFVNWLNSSSGHPEAYRFNGGNFELWQPGDTGYNPDNRFRNSLAHYFLPSADEWYKAAYYDPQFDVYFDYPPGSDTPPIPVAGGVEAGTAVYDQDFSVGPSEITQAGGLSPYGTMAQGGNLEEWDETDFDLVNDNSSSQRGVRGGGWESGPNDLSASARGDDNPSDDDNTYGFRVASIPEPSSRLLAVFALAAVTCLRRRTLGT